MPLFALMVIKIGLTKYKLMSSDSGGDSDGDAFIWCACMYPLKMDCEQ